MSPVEIPQHLTLVLMAALSTGQTTDSAGTQLVGMAPCTSAVMHEVAAGAHDNPYRFPPGPFFDAIMGLGSDQRFGPFARRVFKTSSGQAYVPVMRDAETILALRGDAMIARHVTECYARSNAIALRRALGRDVSLADIYLAHRVGLRFATEILLRERRNARIPAALVLPELDDVAPELVFAGDRALSVGEIVDAVDHAAALALRRAGLERPQRAPRSRHAMEGSAAVPLPHRPVRGARAMGWQTHVARVESRAVPVR